MVLGKLGPKQLGLTVHFFGPDCQEPILDQPRLLAKWVQDSRRVSEPNCPGPNLARTENRALKRGGQAPAITIVGRDAKTLSGWIGNSTDWCQNLKMNESVEECIEEHTYSRSSVLKDVFWGFNTNPYHQQSILNESLVKEDFTMVWQGRFLSVKVPRTMIADTYGSTRLSLALPHQLTFLIFFHDPNFFEINYKPTFPSILKTVNPEGDFNHVYNLGLTEVKGLK